jgi:ATP-dependent DNA helicase HFM1/MER3
MRKLIGQGVKTVKDLVEKNHGELEHILGRNPPFGKTMSDLLKRFPLLSLNLAIPSRKNISVSGGGISVPVVATLRYLNQTGLPNWNNRVPSATFVAETTSGLLVYFWKGSLSKIKNDTGLELRFSAEIKAVHEQIRCYFSCEEIVGTIVTKSLDHNIPISAFRQHSQLIEAAAESRSRGYESEDVTSHECKTPRLQDCTTASSHLHALGEAPSSKSLGSSLSQGDSGDADAVEAAAALLGNMDKPSSSKTEGKKSQSQKTVESDYTDGDFPMIEDILEVMSSQLPRLPQSQTKTNVTARVSAKSVPKDEPVVEKDPVKLPNGKYQCNHACTGGAPTKAGKPCTHRCCLEGLDKPRKLTKKRKADDSLTRDSKQSSAITSSAVSSKTSGTKSKKPRTSQSSTSDLNSSNIPRQCTLQQIKCARASGRDDALTDDFEIECIDLSNVNAKNGDDLPDLESLITYKTMDEAYGAANTKVDGISNSGAGGRQASPLFGSALPPTKDYMKSVPLTTTTTTDFGEMDDDFDEDDLTMFDRDSGDSLTAEPAHKESSHDLLDHGRAFRSGAEDAMLFSGIGHFMPPQKNAEMNDQLGALSPQSYNKALREASKLCDIDSQSSSLFNKGETMSPEDMHLFDSAKGHFTDSTNPTDDKLAPHSRSTTLDGPTGHGPDSSINVALPSVVAPAKLETEPDWVQEFDPEFIDSFRGYVNFV